MPSNLHRIGAVSASTVLLGASCTLADPSRTVSQVLGTGHFSKVRLGIHRQTGEKVAIKIIEKPSGSKVRCICRITAPVCEPVASSHTVCCLRISLRAAHLANVLFQISHAIAKSAWRLDSTLYHLRTVSAPPLRALSPHRIPHDR